MSLWARVSIGRRFCSYRRLTTNCTLEQQILVLICNVLLAFVDRKFELIHKFRCHKSQDNFLAGFSNQQHLTANIPVCSNSDGKPLQNKVKPHNNTCIVCYQPPIVVLMTLNNKQKIKIKTDIVYFFCPTTIITPALAAASAALCIRTTRRPQTPENTNE